MSSRATARAASHVSIRSRFAIPTIIRRTSKRSMNMPRKRAGRSIGRLILRLRRTTNVKPRKPRSSKHKQIDAWGYSNVRTLLFLASLAVLSLLLWAIVILVGSALFLLLTSI